MIRINGRIVLDTPEDYRFDHVLAYLNRNETECLHRVEGRTVYKAVRLGGVTALMAIGLGDGEAAGADAGAAEAPGLRLPADRLGPEKGWAEQEKLRRSVSVRFLNGEPEQPVLDAALAYVREWLDLDSDLSAFYALSEEDPLLGPVVEEFRGLRVIGVPSLLEALCWTVVGQQINLSFAYTLKKRLVETFGTRVVHEGREFMLFPHAEELAALAPEALQELKFSRVKAETLLRIARLTAEKELSKEQLLQMNDFGKAEERLIAIRGIGPWTANYVSMRCLRNPDAFPLADVGLHNAIRRRLGLAEKPPLARVEELASAWRPWRAYATFYLWSTL